MHIIHTESSCGWGGQEIRILEESRGMLEKGHQVQILCPREARLFEAAQTRGIPVEALAIERKNLKGLWAMRRWLKTHPVDILNTHSSTDSWLSALACASLHHPPPIVRTRHISAPIPNNASTRWLYASAATHIVTTGEKLRQTLIEENGFSAEKITSIPTGIDPHRFKPNPQATARAELGLKATARYIGIVATLRSWKGHRYLIDAFLALQSDYPEVELLIVGDGPQQEALAMQIQANGLSERVHLCGLQTHPEKWMQAMDVFCLPSYANEGVPQALLQAMFTGLPIISTPVGAITEAIQHEKTGWIIEPENVAALEAALRRFLNDASLRHACGLAAREQALAHFSFDRMIQKMETVFEHALDTATP